MTRQTDTELRDMRDLRDRLHAIRKSGSKLDGADAILWMQFGFERDAESIQAFGCWASIADGEDAAISRLVFDLSKKIRAREEQHLDRFLATRRESSTETMA